jgi:hypothetical protein
MLLFGNILLIHFFEENSTKKNNVNHQSRLAYFIIDWKTVIAIAGASSVKCLRMTDKTLILQRRQPNSFTFKTFFMLSS